VADREAAQQVWREIEPPLVAQGYELVEVECVPRGRGPLVRVFIDKSVGGITLNDCQAVSELLGGVLDRLEVVGESYLLEVSSPGFDRPLRKRSDFVRFVGEPVQIKTLAPVEGRKRFSGVLRDFADDEVRIECAGTLYRIALGNVHKANLDR